MYGIASVIVAAIVLPLLGVLAVFEVLCAHSAHAHVRWDRRLAHCCLLYFGSRARCHADCWYDTEASSH